MGGGGDRARRGVCNGRRVERGIYAPPRSAADALALVDPAGGACHRRRGGARALRACARHGTRHALGARARVDARPAGARGPRKCLGSRGRRGVRHLRDRRCGLVRLRGTGALARRRPADRHGADQRRVHVAGRRGDVHAARLHAGPHTRGHCAQVSARAGAADGAPRGDVRARDLSARAVFRRAARVDDVPLRIRARRSARGRRGGRAAFDQPDVPVSGRAADERRPRRGLLARCAARRLSGDAAARRGGGRDLVARHPDPAKPGAACRGRARRGLALVRQRPRAPARASGGGIRHRDAARTPRARLGAGGPLRIAARVRVRHRLGRVLGQLHPREPHALSTPG